MSKIVLILLIITVGILAEPIVLITQNNSPIKTLTKSQVQMIYLKQRRYWGDIKIVTLNLPPKHTIRKIFEKNILEMSQTQLEYYWLKQHYQGYRPPYRVETVKSVLMFVKKVNGAIGYIPQSSVNDDVKVIYRTMK